MAATHQGFTQRLIASPIVRVVIPLAIFSGLVLLAWPGLRTEIFREADYMPHGHCYLWQPWLVRLHFWSDLLIGIAYVAISFMLTYLVYRARQDMPFSWMFLAFGTFIVACGGTHFMEVWNLRHADYWLAGAVKLLTAVASVATALLLPALIPKAVALGETARASEERRTRLAAANRELESFSYSISHDLRTPLRSINGFSQALAEDLGDRLGPEGKAHLDRIRAASLHMGNLIDDLLDLSRLVRKDLKREDVDLSALAHDIADDLRRLEPKRAAQFQIEPGLVVKGDVELLRVVIQNLFDNAWKFTQDRPETLIAFGRSSKDGEAFFFVRDNGVGFDMAYADKLFKPFERLHSGTFKGTGIGLTSVQNIVQRHRGKIWANSAPGEGATFSFTLPQRRDPRRPHAASV